MLCLFLLLVLAQIGLEGSIAHHRVGDLRGRIKELKESLKGVVIEAGAINAQQEILDQPVENYTPDITKCGDLLEPFSVLWETIGQYLDAHHRWYKTPLLKLNPVSAPLYPSFVTSSPHCVFHAVLLSMYFDLLVH